MRNILVVEDSQLVLNVLERMFRQQADLQPLFCASLHEAQVLLETSAELFAAAVETGMRTLKMDGMEKIMMGLTDLKMVRSVCIK